MRDRALILCAAVLALLAPVVTAVRALAVPPDSPAVLLLIASIAIIAGIFGGVAAAFDKSPGPKSALTPIATAIVLLLMIDASVGGHALLESFTTDRPAKAGVLLLTFLVGSTVFWVIREKLAIIAFVGAAAAFSLSLIVRSDVLVTRAAAQEPNAPIIYVVLDEMIGPEGIDRSVPGGEETYEAVRGLFERHQFKLYGKAFSRHFLSVRAIPATLNFDFNEDYAGRLSKYASRSATELGQVALFDRMAADGFRVKVRQSAHINFCAASDVECVSFPSFNPQSAYANIGSAAYRATMLVMQEAFAESYLLYNVTRILVPVFGDPSDVVPTFFDIHGFPLWFDEFAEDVTNAKPGQMFFTHFLLPHNPAVLNASCEAQRRWVSPYYLVEQRNLTGTQFDAMRSQFYSWYYGQVGCLLSKLDGFLTKIEEMPSLQQATIVFHGDHGSRISSGHFIENLSKRDMIDNYSALYAIKGPGIEPGYDSRKVSIQRLTAEYFSGKTLEELGPDNPNVVIDSKEQGKVVLREMPDF